MDQQVQGQRFSRSSNGKRSKEKKIPQRGLGVAQLEKIRLDEQRKGVLSDSDIPIISPSNSTFTRTNCYIRPEQEFRSVWSNSDNHFLQPPIGSMVNVTTQCSISSFQIEPPSNQILYANTSNFVLSEQEKIIGNKRPYWFVDNPRHTHSNSSELFIPWGSSNPIRKPNSKKTKIESNTANGNFLTLSVPSSKFDAFDLEIQDFETTHFQGIEKNSNFPTEPRGSSTQQRPFYSFFPPANKLGYESSAVSEAHSFSNGINENVDLSLKL